MRADLIEAYVGRHEDELREEYEKEVIGSEVAVPSFEYWAQTAVLGRIYRDDDRARLETFLAWNGIGGYTTAIFEIANGGGLE